jgi:predicted nucleotidyltransferase
MPIPSALDVRRPPDRRKQDLPARYRARVLAVFPGQIERIVMFGLRARGEPHAESDWDFAVFFRHPPGEAESSKLAEVDWEVGQSFGCLIQSLDFPREGWLARSELACNIRDHGLIIYGPNDVPGSSGRSCSMPAPLLPRRSDSPSFRPRRPTIASKE